MWFSVSTDIWNRAVLLTVLIGFLTTPLSLPAQDESQTQPEDAPPTDEQLPRLETCIKKLRDWRSTWVTIRINSHEWNLKDMAKCNPDADPDTPDYIEKHSPRHEFVWADWGALRFEIRTVMAGKEDYVTSLGSDGERPWGSQSEMGNPDVLKLVQFYQPIQDRPLSVNWVIVPIRGLWFNQPGRWLDEELEKNPWTVMGLEEVDGHRCVKVYWVTDRKSKTVWLDPEQQFLPRKLLALGKPHPSNNSRREFPDPHTGEKTWSRAYTWQASEISKVDGILFPSRGTFDENDWKIDHITVNEPLDRSFFAAPKGQPGVTGFIDYANGKTWKTADPNRSDEPPVAEETDVAPSGPLVEAVPEQSLWKWLGRPEQSVCSPEPASHCGGVGRLHPDNGGNTMRRMCQIQWSLIVAGLLLCGSAVAETLPDQECLPAAMPVTECECPVGTSNTDYCEGALPKAGACMYGDVMCWMSPGETCEHSGSGANPCGRVVDLKQGPPCGAGVWDFCDPATGEIYEPVPYPTKPPCTNTWGQCEYSEPPPSP